MILTRLNAIESLYPDKNLSYNSENNTCIINGEEVKDYASIDAEVKRLQDEYDSQEYARNRKAEYDALNQLEMQFDDKKNSTTTWDDAIDAIKAKWPKDNSGPV